MKKVMILILFLVSTKIFAAVSAFPSVVPNPNLNPQQKDYLRALSQTPNVLLVQPPNNIRNVLNGVGIGINGQQSLKLMQEFNKIINIRATASPGMPLTFMNLKNMFPYLNNQQAAKLYYALQNEGSNLDPTDRLFAALFLEALGIQLLTKEALLLQQVKAVVQPSQPTSPTMTLSKNMTSGVMNNMVRNNQVGKPTGEFGLDNIYVAGDYSYTEYDFTDTNDTGHIHYKSLTLGGDFSEQFSFAFSFFHDQVDQRGPNDLLSNQLGLSLALTYNITDNYSFSAFGFYSEADIEEINDNTFTYGGGLLFSTYHRFGDFDVSTANTIVRSVTDFGNDLLWLANLRLGYHWTDEFSTGIYGYYVDSMDEDVDIDSSYTIIGGDMTYQLTEQIGLTLGFESVQHLKNYKSETYYISVLYKF